MYCYAPLSDSFKMYQGLPILGFHMTSRGIHFWVSAIMEPLGSLIHVMQISTISIAVHKSLAILFDLIMDISQENCNEDLDSLSKDIDRKSVV